MRVKTRIHWIICKCDRRLGTVNLPDKTPCESRAVATGRNDEIKPERALQR